MLILKNATRYNDEDSNSQPSLSPQVIQFSQLISRVLLLYIVYMLSIVAVPSFPCRRFNPYLKLQECRPKHTPMRNTSLEDCRGLPKSGRERI